MIRESPSLATSHPYDQRPIIILQPRKKRQKLKSLLHQYTSTHSGRAVHGRWLYTAVVKKPKGTAVKYEENAPPISPYTIDIAVKRDSKDKAETEEDTPSLPPHIVEELYTAILKKLKSNAEAEEAIAIPPYTSDTAVKRDLKNKAENEEVAPLIPPHIVEELYTAVQKSFVEIEEVAPPIPAYMANKL